jgi:hypothetical protein
MGGGEVARYIGRHGTSRLSEAGLISAVPPLMLQTPSNPGGSPLTAFDGIRAGVRTDRSQLFYYVSHVFFGVNQAARFAGSAHEVTSIPIHMLAHREGLQRDQGSRYRE